MYDTISDILIKFSNFVEAHGAETASQILAYQTAYSILTIVVAVFIIILSIFSVVLAWRQDDKEFASGVTIVLSIFTIVPALMTFCAIDTLMMVYFAPNLVVMQYFM